MHRALAAVSLGGMVGALARAGLAAAWPGPHSSFPWATWVTNLTGCLLIGALMVVAHHRPLLRAFLGVGVLGGYTTFSAYAVETVHLAQSPWTAVAYLAGTAVGAVAAAWAGTTLTRRVMRP
jgi:CrcB protein